jgi:DNA repair photolyase
MTSLGPDGAVKNAKIIYAPAGEAGEYAPLATNPYRGCGHACSYCLDGDTLITMADGESKKISEINVGDEIIGVVVENGRIVSSQTTKVLAKIENKRSAEKIEFEDGSHVICSSDHRWLTNEGWMLCEDIKKEIAKPKYLFVLNNNSAVRVTNVFSLSKETVMYDIMTGTETFFANGLVSHNCYVPIVIHMKRPDFDAGATLRNNYIQRLEAEARKYQELEINEQVMLSFSTDPYHLGDTAPTRQTLEILMKYGLGFCTLTKGGSRALRDIDLFRKDRDAFACTLTSVDNDFAAKWERRAAAPTNRMQTLKSFHDKGIFTWVSIEPTLDISSALEVIRQTHEYVDLYKIGRANYIPSLGRSIDWKEYTERVIELCQNLGVKHYIKKKLQEFLPVGYHNPMRIPQYHRPDISLSETGLNKW